MFDKFLRDRETMDRQTGEISVEPTSSPLRDEDKARLDSIKQELEQERQKFTKATIRLGKERAEIEVNLFSVSCLSN